MLVELFQVVLKLLNFIILTHFIIYFSQVLIKSFCFLNDFLSIHNWSFPSLVDFLFQRIKINYTRILTYKPSVICCLKLRMSSRTPHNWTSHYTHLWIWIISSKVLDGLFLLLLKLSLFSLLKFFKIRTEFLKSFFFHIS